MNIDQFIATLAEQASNGSWLNSAGQIRSRRDHRPDTLPFSYDCPITFLAFQLTGKSFSINDWLLAADALDLNPLDADNIVNAADHPAPHPYCRSPALRAQLLTAVGLQPEKGGDS